MADLVGSVVEYVAWGTGREPGRGRDLILYAPCAPVLQLRTWNSVGSPWHSRYCCWASAVVRSRAPPAAFDIFWFWNTSERQQPTIRILLLRPHTIFLSHFPRIRIRLCFSQHWHFDPPFVFVVAFGPVPSCALLPWPPPPLKNHSSVLSGSYAFRIRCSHALRPPSAEVYYYCAGFVHPFALSFSCCYTCRLSPYLPVFPYLVFATTSSPSPHPIIPGLGLGRCLPQFHAVVSHRTVPAALPASSTVRYLHTQLNDMVHTDAFVGTSPSDAPRPSNAVGTTTALPSHTTPVISRGGSRQSVPPSFFLQKPPRTSIKSMSRLTSARRRAGWCEAEASTYGHVRRLAQRGGDQLQVPFERSS